ncbi:MAG TPA: class I SAM-dependent methyltransferase [Sphingobium sp.]|uniref:class I SAM-dependent methyltransferase n=1 Tax=Sphingobium sp. TaxID=1912891 RepID=UPI002ED061AD
MTQSHESIVQQQFGPQAAAYVTSAVHAQGPDLDRIAAIAAEVSPAHALDLGAGGGHVSYALAPHAQAVTASDLSADMIAAIRAHAAGQGLANISGEVAPAEALPFADGAFDLLACRFTAHHWRAFEAGLREARRVLAPGAPAIFVDVVAPEQAQADVHLQAVELLRDPSHVRDYRASEWIAALGRAGFTVQAMRTHRLRMDFAVWTERMRTPEAHVAAIRSLQSMVAADVARHFALEEDGSFTLDVALFEAV